MLLLSRFSRVRLCATPETAAHQAPPSLGLSRQEHWSPTPKWLWDNDAATGLPNRRGGVGSGRFRTNYVKCWLQELAVREQYLLTEDIVFS